MNKSSFFTLFDRLSLANPGNHSILSFKLDEILIFSMKMLKSEAKRS